MVAVLQGNALRWTSRRIATKAPPAPDSANETPTDTAAARSKVQVEFHATAYREAASPVRPPNSSPLSHSRLRMNST